MQSMLRIIGMREVASRLNFSGLESKSLDPAPAGIKMVLESGLKPAHPMALDQRPAELILMPGYNAVLYSSQKGDDCNKLAKKKSGTVCQPPAEKNRVLPPYDYGYCKEVTPPPLTSCPPAPKKSKKGPCCLEKPDTKKTGCKSL